MRIATCKVVLPVLLAVSLLIGAFPIPIAHAQSRTPVPPPDAPADAILVEGETGQFANNAGVASDQPHSGTGFAVLDHNSPNARVTYTITVDSAGPYKLALNYAAGRVGGSSDDRSINLYVNGDVENKVTLTFPGTIGWANWQYLIIQVDLNAGQNTIAFETNGIRNGVNFDYFYYWLYVPVGEITGIQFTTNEILLTAGKSIATVVQAVYDSGDMIRITEGVTYQSSNENVARVDDNGVITGVAEGRATVTATYQSWQTSVEVTVQELPTIPHPNAQVYQAEDAQLSGGAIVATNHTGYTGTGFVAGYDFSGTARTTFTVNVPAEGEYWISLRYSAGAVPGWPTNRTVGLSVNGGDTIPVTFIGTDASWNTWEENILRVQLNAGANTIAYFCLTGPGDNSDVINLDRLSVWPYSDNPVIDALAFDSDQYTVSEHSSVSTIIYGVNTNGIRKEYTSEVVYSSADPSIAEVNEQGVITGLKAGTTTITGESDGLTATATVIVVPNPTVTVDFDKVTRPVDPSMFGILLTPNYDIPDSRMTLLGPLLNRDTIPAQNFQAISDLDPAYYQYEGSILPRALQAYERAKSVGYKYYFLLGHNSSWTTPSGGPIENREKSPEQLARFKQYIKDVLQYFKDNGAVPDFANLTNEGWTGGEKTYHALWEALREVYPDPIPAVGPGGVGFNGIPDFYIPYASANHITIEGPAWHEFWSGDTFAPLSQVQFWVNRVSSLMTQYPEANGKYLIWEENNAFSTHPGDWTRSMANVVRAGVTYNIKGTVQQYNWNSMSNLLQAVKSLNSPNPAIRTPIWWVYYMFTQMSGEFVDVSTNGNEFFTAAASKDVYESKIIFVKDDVDGSVNLDLRNQPYSGQDIKIDLYKITDSENNGLEYQYSLYPDSTKDILVRVDNILANESWMAIVKRMDAPPSFFHPLTPDDGEVVLSNPTLTWSESQDAASYTVTVSTHKDLSNPVIRKSGIMGTSYTVETPLAVGQKYYWTVSAENDYGSTTVPHRTVYSFIVGTNTNVPGQFGPYMPTIGAWNESVTPEFKWSTAYNATSYRLVVSKNPDLSDPVINQDNITNVRDTPHFGPKSQVYYQPSVPLEYDTTYYWMVYAVNEHGERPMNGPLHYFTTKAPGDAPTEFGLLEPENGAENVSTRAVLSWEPSKNAFFYKLEVSENPDMSNPIIVRDRMIYNKYTVEPNLLLPNKTYYWRVTAYTKDLAHQTESRDGIRAFTTEAVPSAPLLYAEHGSGDKVKLWFQPSITATSYKIKYGKAPGQYTETITGVMESPYEVSGLPNGTYYFAVVAVNDAGESSIWNERSVTLTESEVEPPTVPVTGVSLNKSVLNLKVGETEQLIATVSPSDATDKSVMWSSSNSNVATVDGTGLVAAVGVGTATITVVTVDGGKSASATVVVTDPASSDQPPSNQTPPTQETSDSEPSEPMITVEGGKVTVQLQPDAGEVANIALTADDIRTALKNNTERTLAIAVIPTDNTNEVNVDLPIQDLLNNTSLDAIVIDVGLAAIMIHPSLLENQGVSSHLQLSITKVDATTLPAGARSQLNGADVLDIELRFEGIPVADIPKHYVQVFVPYTLKPAENPNKVVVYYVGDDGQLEIVKNGKYDPVTGRMVFRAEHFSKYAVVYRDVSFGDIETVPWAKEAIEALAAREAIKGLGNGIFNPNGYVTRAEFIQMLVSTFELFDPSAKATFKDVRSDAWYADAVASAQKWGIIRGKPDGSFGVNDPITRQDMAVMLYRTAQTMDIRLETHETSPFKDDSAIGDYAREAVYALSHAGIVRGTGNDLFAPKEKSTRAQAATMIFRLFNQ